MGCLAGIKQKSHIYATSSNKMIPKIEEKNNVDKENIIQIYKRKNIEEVNKQTSISQNVQSLIDNNPIPFVKIIKKKN
jgi:hypothetical protein